MNATKPAKIWQINTIQTAMRNHGSHWWDAGTMRYFRSRVSSEVFQGPGGVFFVTSERYSDEAPRLYTVRRFDPETKDISTASEFQEYKSASGARGRAKREAAGPDGHINPSAAHDSDIQVNPEKHQPVTDGDDFALLMRRELPDLTDSNREKLQRLARQHCRYQEMRCGDGSPSEVANAALADRRYPGIQKQILAILEPIGAGAVFGGDPRGCTVKITIPSGYVDDFGREGICVPGG